jgi:hypothetical protein
MNCKCWWQLETLVVFLGNIFYVDQKHCVIHNILPIFGVVTHFVWESGQNWQKWSKSGHSDL